MSPPYDFHQPGVPDLGFDPDEEEGWHERNVLDISGQAEGTIRVSDVPPERVSWLWANRLPLGKLVVLDGDPGLLKSTLTLDWSARITTGAPWPDGSPVGLVGAVVLLTAEDGIGDTVRPRLAAHGADLGRVVVFDSVPSFDDDGKRLPNRPPSIPGDLPKLENIVNDERAALVVVDPLSAFLSGRVDSHRDQDVRGALMPLARLAERTGACVVVVRHLSKAGGANPLYRGGGSIGIIGAARAAMLVAPDPSDDGRRILAMTKSNLAPIAPSLAYRSITDEEHGCGRIVWDGTTEHRAADLLTFESDEDRTAGNGAAEFLVELLSSEGPMPGVEVKKLGRQAGIAERTLERACKKAGVETSRSGFGKGAVYMWRLASSCTPSDDHARHVRQESDAGEHGAHEDVSGEHERARLPAVEAID